MNVENCGDNMNFSNCMDCGRWEFNRLPQTKCDGCGSLNIILFSCAVGIKMLTDENKSLRMQLDAFGDFE